MNDSKATKDDAPRCSAAVRRISGDMQCLKLGSYKCGGCGRPLCGQHCNPSVLQACAKGKHQAWGDVEVLEMWMKHEGKQYHWFEIEGIAEPKPCECGHPTPQNRVSSDAE